MTFLATLLARYAAGRWLQANWGWLKYLAITLAVLGLLWAVHSHIWHAGYDAADSEWKARQQAAQAKAQADSWEYIDTLHGIDVSLTADKAQTQQLRTIYRDRIRTVAVDVYRDRQCDLPRGVFDDLNAIRAGTALPVVGGNDGALPTAPALDGSDHPNTGHSRR
jgi:hypothetical protein